MDKLVRLIADYELGHSELADLLFVPRFDCAVNPGVFAHASRKFNVFSYTSKKRETGWPRGCNSIVFSALEWAYRKISARQVPSYKALFVMAADTAPLRRDWLPLLSNTWDTLQNPLKPAYVAGCLLAETPYVHTHINGDAMLLSCDLKFLKWLAVTAGCPDACVGWDYAYAKDFERWGWSNIPFIKSHWRRGDFAREEWDNEVRESTIILHGVKTEALLDLCREKNL